MENPSVGIHPMPRVSGLPLVGAVPHVLWKKLGFFEDAMARKGRIFELDLGLANVVIVADVEAAEDVLIRHAENFDKSGEFWDGLRDTLGDALSTNEGEVWRRQRRFMQPKFQRRLIEGYREAIVETVMHELDALPVGRTIEVDQWCDQLFAAVTMRILFGSELDRSLVDETREMMLGLSSALLGGVVTRRLPEWLPIPARRRLAHAQRFMSECARTLIAERRRRPGPSHDLLGMLLEATDEHGVMSDEQLRAEVMNFYLAGFETTGSALAWTVWLLATHPRVRAELQAELDAGEDRDEEQNEGSGRVSLLRACIQEGLRLFPPAPFLPRRAVADHVLGGHLVRARTHVMVSPWLIHRDPALWPDPHAFDPGRFMSSEVSSRRPRLAWLPFGAGQRVCIGKGLAMLELEESLRLLLRRFTPVAAPDAEPPVPRLAGTMRATRGIPVVMQPRENATPLRREAGPAPRCPRAS